jgi:hypothetical protein
MGKQGSGKRQPQRSSYLLSAALARGNKQNNCYLSKPHRAETIGRLQTLYIRMTGSILLIHVINVN